MLPEIGKRFFGIEFKMHATMIHIIYACRKRIIDGLRQTMKQAAHGGLQRDVNCSKVDSLFITHALPKNLLVDEVVRIGVGSLEVVGDANTEQRG